MDLDINRLRRRTPGPKILVQLDQSLLSDLACDDRCSATRELLVAGVRSDMLVCPASPGAVDETLDASKSWKDISELQSELSLGISFLDELTIARNEAFVAAANFAGQDPHYSLASEAFDDDPHTLRAELFADRVRVSAGFGPTEVRSSEVAHEKDKEDIVQAAYDQTRRLGRSFEQQAQVEYEAMLNRILGPLADPSFDAELARKQAALLSSSDWSLGPGTPMSRFIAISQRGQFATDLVETFPALAERASEFVESVELGHMPSLRYPALLRAALATMSGRNAHRGDGYDIAHLTCGLSRCDVLTADGGMTELVRGRQLAPDGCAVFSRREISKFHRAVDLALATSQ